jgi:hypothetical protein
MAEEFEGLSAEYEDDIKPETDSVDLPNHVKTRPIIFRMLGGSGEMSAKTAGFRIVQALQEIAKEGDASSATEVLIFMEGSHLSLFPTFGFLHLGGHPEPHETHHARQPSQVQDGQQGTDCALGPTQRRER